MQQNTDESLLRLSQIIGKKNENEPMVPVSRSTWLLWVKQGRAPASLKLGPRTTCWRRSDVIAFMKEAQ